MKVIARIPTLVPEPAPDQAPPSPQPERPPAAVRRERAEPRPRLRQRFPGASVAVLAVLAAIAWSLASWNDVRRLERAKQERVARMQAFENAPGTVAR